MFPAGQLRRYAADLSKQAKDMHRLALEIEAMPTPLGAHIIRLAHALREHGLCIIHTDTLHKLTDYINADESEQEDEGAKNALIRAITNSLTPPMLSKDEAPEAVELPRELMFNGVGARKLGELLADGFKINGYAIEKPGDTPKRALITMGGLVGWWSPNQQPQEPAPRPRGEKAYRCVGCQGVYLTKISSCDCSPVNGPFKYTECVIVDAEETPPAEGMTGAERDLSMHIRCIVSSARRHCAAGSPVLEKANAAWDYLVRKGLQGSPLREEKADK